MDVKDLMIGDWVHYWILNINAKVNDVMSTGRLGIRFIDSKGKEGYIHGVICETVKPIPLTAEILEKNGFKKELSEDNIHYRFVLIYDGVRFSLLYARSVFQWLGPLDFKFVHELQHALRLCGINKEIEI